jgi:hypothetical protein
MNLRTILPAIAILGAGVPTTVPVLTHSIAEARPGSICGADTYRNVDGQCVRRPTKAPTAPSGATAKCRDGTYSFSQHRQGTCSHHGGVAKWL